MQFIPNSHGAYMIDHLYDGTLYIFSVTAVDALDSAGTSTFSTVFIPSCALCIIRSESGDSFIKMSLSPLPFPAVVSGKAVDSADAADAREANLPEGFKEVLISGLQPGVLYQFDVKNVDTEEVVYMSRYRVVPDPVENLQIRLVSTTSCIATYEPPATDTGQKIDGYRIISSLTNSTSDSVITIRNKSQTSVLIENLEPGIEYTIEVQTFSGEIANLLYSSPKNATVVRADFGLVENTNTSITVQWEIPRDGNPVGFQLRYGVANTSEVNHLSLNASSSTTTISGLQPGQKYQVDLYLVSHEGLLSFYSSAVFQTEPNAISNITGTSTATSISLTWNHPLGGADSYIIEYNSSSPIAPLVTDRQSVIIRRLSPGAVYEVNIATVHGIARSSPTTAYFLTDSLSEGEMEVHSVTSDSIGVTWGAMPDTLDVAYIFAISPSEGHRTEEISNHRVEFANLTSGRLFTISLLYRSSLDSEDYNRSFIQQRTLPAAPYSVAITSLEPVDYFALHVSWMLPPTGDWDRIRITITQVDGSPDYVLVGKRDTSFVIKPLLQDTFYMIGVTSVSGLDETQQESEPVSRTATTSPLRDGHLVVTSYDQESTTVSWHWLPAVTYIALCREVGREMGEDYKGLIEPSSNSVTKFTYASLVPGRNYEFFIRRSDDIGLYIKLSQRTVPSSPGTLTASALGAQSIRLDWSGAANDVERYEITTYPSDGGNGVQYVKMVAGSVFSTTIDGLIEDTNYTTEVRAISGSGESLEKSMPSTATTATEPIIMGVTLSLETFLPIRFTPISGTFDAYRYGYRKLPGDGQFSYTDLSKAVPPYFDIMELRPGALYEITLDTRNGSAYTEIDRIQARTKPSKPSSMILTNLEDKSFTVNWTAPPLVDVDFIGFYLTYEPLGSGITSPLFLDKTQTSQILTGLEPATNYTVTVVTVSGEGSSEQISFPETIKATTAHGIQGGVNVREVTTTLIRISWNKVPGVYSYIPQINPNEGTVIHLEQQATFEGLTPGHFYTISIHWIGNSGPATQIYTKPKPPLDLTIPGIAANELDISWRPPPDGLYDSYKLSYSQVLTNDITTIAVLSSDDPSVSLIDLKAETSYDISIVSVRGTSVSEPIKTSGTTGRRVFDVLTLVDRTTTTITVRWGTSRDPSSEGYEIWIEPTGGVQQLVTTLQLSTDTYTLTNLTSGTTYVINLVIAGLDRIEELEVTTYPLTPGVIHILTTTQTRITFTWGKSSGDFDCYSIFFFMVGSEVAFLQDVPRGGNRTISKNFLTPGTKYKIKIYTKTGATTSSSTETTVSTDPELLTFEPIGKYGIRISWMNAIEAGHYFLEVTLLSGMSLGLFRAKEKHLELNDALPGQPYNFRLSFNETTLIGLAEATYLLAPLEPSVEVRTKSATSVHVSITADPFGIVDHFVVDVSIQQTSLDNGHSSTTSFEIPTEACPEVTLTHLIPGRSYTIKVTAVSGETGSAGTRTNVSLGTLTPGEVFLNEKTSTSIEVFWGAVTGNLKNYWVYLLNGLSRQRTQLHGINQEHKALFEGLLPGTQYTVALLLESDGGTLIQQSILSVTTVPEAPKNLSFSLFGSEIILSWLPVTSNIEHYELCWTPYNKVRQMSRDLAQEVISLQPLNAQYTISLYTVIGDGDDRTRSSHVTCVISLPTGLSTEADTSSSMDSMQMTSEATFTTPVIEEDKKYYIIGVVLGLIISCIGCSLGIYFFLKKSGKCKLAQRPKSQTVEIEHLHLVDINSDYETIWKTADREDLTRNNSTNFRRNSPTECINPNMTPPNRPLPPPPLPPPLLPPIPSGCINSKLTPSKMPRPPIPIPPNCILGHSLFPSQALQHNKHDQTPENEHEDYYDDPSDKTPEPENKSVGSMHVPSDVRSEPESEGEIYEDYDCDQLGCINSKLTPSKMPRPPIPIPRNRILRRSLFPSQVLQHNKHDQTPENEHEDYYDDQSDKTPEPENKSVGSMHVPCDVTSEPESGEDINENYDCDQSDQTQEQENESVDSMHVPCDVTSEPESEDNIYDFCDCDQSDQTPEPENESVGSMHAIPVEPENEHDSMNCDQSDQTQEPENESVGSMHVPSDVTSEPENEHEDCTYEPSTPPQIAVEPENEHVNMNCDQSDQTPEPEIESVGSMHVPFDVTSQPENEHEDCTYEPSTPPQIAVEPENEHVNMNCDQSDQTPEQALMNSKSNKDDHHVLRSHDGYDIERVKGCAKNAMSLPAVESTSEPLCDPENSAKPPGVDEQLLSMHSASVTGAILEQGSFKGCQIKESTEKASLVCMEKNSKPSIAKDVNVQVINEVPSDLKLEECEVLIAPGLKWQPSNSPVIINMPHSAEFDNPRKAQIIMYVRKYGTESFRAILCTGDGIPRCVVRQHDLDLYINDFTECWIVASTNHGFIGKRIICTSHVPISAIKDKDLLDLHITDSGNAKRLCREPCRCLTDRTDSSDLNHGGSTGSPAVITHSFQPSSNEDSYTYIKVDVEGNSVYERYYSVPFYDEAHRCSCVSSGKREVNGEKVTDDLILDLSQALRRPQFYSIQVALGIPFNEAEAIMERDSYLFEKYMYLLHKWVDASENTTRYALHTALVNAKAGGAITKVFCTCKCNHGAVVPTFHRV